jgi:hypothetical protein
MMRLSPILGALLLCIAALTAIGSESDPKPNSAEEAAKAAEAAKALPAKYQEKPLLFVPMLPAPAKLSGDLKDPLWEKAASFKMVTMKSEPAKFNTEVRLFCTKEALYIGVKCEEPEPENVAVNNGAAWQNDSIEFFIYPGASASGGKLYYQTVVDAANKLETYHCHLYPKKPQIQGLQGQWSPRIDHEVVKGEKCWTLEERITFSELKLTPEALAKKTAWRMDIFRNRCQRDNESVQNYCWAPTGDSAYHLPARYGYIVLGAFATPEWIAEFSKQAQEKPDEPPGPELVREAHDLIGRLGHNDYVERSLAMNGLNDMLSGTRSLIPLVKTILSDVVKKTPDSEVKQRAAKLLYMCSTLQSSDDDVPPPGVQAQANGL